MQDEGQGLRAILGEEQIALLSRVNQLAGMAEEAFLETVMAEAKGRADPFTALALRCAAGAQDGWRLLVRRMRPRESAQEFSSAALSPQAHDLLATVPALQGMGPSPDPRFLKLVPALSLLHT